MQEIDHLQDLDWVVIIKFSNVVLSEVVWGVD